MSINPTNIDKDGGLISLLNKMGQRIEKLERDRANGLYLKEGEVLSLSSSNGGSYLIYNSAESRIEVYVDGALVQTFS